MTEILDKDDKIKDIAILLDFMAISVIRDITQVLDVISCLFNMQISFQGCIIRQWFERR